MDTHAYTLIATEGPVKGQSFTIDRSLKLGRSSQSDIAIPDLELSRSHCCLELRDGELWVIDLASANQTFVNGEAVEERRLSDRDILSVGSNTFLVSDAAAKKDEAVAPEDGEIDLGFGNGSHETAAPKKGTLRPLLWSVVAILILIAGATYILGRKDERDVKPVQRTPEVPKTLQIRYEKVEADTNGVFRYELCLSADHMLSVKIDDLREKNRNIRKEKKLGDAQLAELTQEVASSGFFSLEKAYTGFAKPGTMNSYSLFASLGPKAHLCTVAEKEEPPAFRTLREKLETFSKNELGIWAIQFSSDKLTELAKEAQRIGANKYAERDVNYGNLSESIRSYRDAIFYLDTVNPKPDFYVEIIEGFETAEQELDKRYKEQRFLADRAINLQEWPAAVRELRVLCELIPDRDDKRHKEAAQKLLDVEGRLKKR